MNTFEVTIQRQVDNHWPLVVRHQPGTGSLALWSRGTLEFDPQKLELMLPTSREFGQALGKAIFRDDVRDAFVRAIAEAKAVDEPLRVLLFIEAEDLRHLHWEQLFAPLDRGWDYLLLNQATPFSLYLPSQIERRYPPIGRRDLRALVLVAGPEELAGDYGLEPFDVAATVESVRTALGEIPVDVLASVPDAVGPPTLEALLGQLIAGKHTLLHIVAHGAYIAEKDETVIYFPRDEKRAPVRSGELIERPSRLDRLPQFTFLSTCESADPKAESGLGGLAQRLVRDLGMPAVLAMTDKVSIPTAEALASSFYARLREHGEIDRALSEAMGTLQGRFDVTVPALFSRLGGRALFSDTLDRPLTAQEIRYGLDLLPALVKQRAPVLAKDSTVLIDKLRAATGADLSALSAETRLEFESNLNALNQLCTEILDISFNALALGQEPPAYDERCPFLGLMAFKPDNQEFFFGREALVEKLQEKLKQHNFLAVLGPSGSGKSSLVLAGLVPALNLSWILLTPGDNPSAALETVKDEHQVVIIDQFEELFTLTTDEATRQAYITRLLTLSQDRKVILTLRADFWGEVARYAKFKDEMQAHQELVAPMSPDELHNAIDRQAEKVGLRFEGDLGQDILDDVQKEPGAMPLLQHALLLLWERRHGRWLRLDEYRTIGGIENAIAKTADGLFEGLSQGEQERVRDIFMRLTRLDDETNHDEVRDTRRRVSLEELVPSGSNPEATKALISKLAGARLVVTDEAQGNKETVEVAHEALIRKWPRLRAWLDEDRPSLRLRESIRQAALDWDARQRDESSLIHRGARLEDARALSRQPRFAFNTFEKSYLDACLQFAEKERKANENRRLITMVSTIAVAMVTTALALYGFYQSNRATKSAIVAQSRELAALSQNVMSDSPPRGMLLAIEAWQKSPQPEAEEALRQALADPHGIPLIGHNAPVRTIAFSPVTEVMATGGNDGTVRLWDASAPDPAVDPIILSGHNAPITALAYSPDGNWLASTDQDGLAILWNANDPSSNPVQLAGHTKWITDLAFSPHSEILATASLDSTIIIWDMFNPGTKLKVFEAAGREVKTLAISPDGNWLASGHADHNVRLWDLTDLNTPPRILETGETYSLTYTDMAFSKDGFWLVAGSQEEGITLVWDVLSFKLPTRPLLSHTDWINSIVFIDNDRVASASGDKTIALTDLSPLRRNLDYFSIPNLNPILLRGHSAYINQLAVSPDGQWLGSASGDGTVRLWDISPNNLAGNVRILRGHEQQVYALAFSKDSQWLGTVSQDGTARLWAMNDFANDFSIVDIKHGSTNNPNVDPIVLFSHNDKINALAFNPNGFQLVTASGSEMIQTEGTHKIFSDNSIYAWDISKIKQASSPQKLSDGVTGMGWVGKAIFSPDGHWMAAGGGEGVDVDISFEGDTPVWLASVWLWDATNLSPNPQKLTAHKGYISALAFSRDSKLLASGSQDKTVRVWDVRSGTSTELSGFDERIDGLAFSPDGRWLAASSGFYAYLYDANNLSAAPTKLEGHSDWITSLAFSPDGKLLATGSRDKTVRLWKVDETAAQPIILDGNADWVTIIAFNPAGNWLAAAGRDKSIHIWSLKHPEKEMITLSGHEKTITALAFSADGYWLASASEDFTARLWNLSKMTSVALRSHTDVITSLVFSPNSQWLATGSKDKTTRLWRVNIDELIDLACQSAGRNLSEKEWGQYFPNEGYRVTCSQWAENP